MSRLASPIKKRAKKQSDFTPLPHDVLNALPKASLHRHLDGSARISTIIELAREQHVELPTFDEEELRSMICVEGTTCASLEDYLRGFEITLRVMQRAYAITRVVYEVAEDCAADGITYVEIRFSPVLHTSLGHAPSTVLEAVLDGRVLAEMRLPIVVRVIICGMRQMNPQIVKSLAEICWRRRGDGVVAFDLAGPERGFNSRIHAEAFELIHERLVSVTLHAGEGVDVSYIQDAIRSCGAQRIGHGVALKDESEAGRDLLAYVVDRGIFIESCPTSNVQTGSVAAYAEHPIRRFFDEGARICVDVDNSTVSHVTLTQELDRLQRAFHFSPEELVRMLMYAFTGAFLSSTVRSRIAAEAFHTALSVLRRANVDVSAIVSGEHRAFYADFGLLLDQDVLTPEQSYWGGYSNPPLTLELARRLPKADVHLRFEGGVSKEWLWQQLELEAAGSIDRRTQLLESFQLAPSPPADFVTFAATLCRADHSHESLERAKQVCRHFLQTREQLRSAIENVMTSAAADGVTYAECMLRPAQHALGALTAEEAARVVIERAAELEASLGVRFRFVLYASLRQSPIEALDVARLVVRLRSELPSVVGMGFYGPPESEITDATAKFFQPVFDLLKANNVKVALLAGQQVPANIIVALKLGATRLSGAFSVHSEPTLCQYLSTHSVPIELAPTAAMKQATQDVRVFNAQRLRIYKDVGLEILLASFHSALSSYTRSETLLYAVQRNSLDANGIVDLLASGFRSNFAPFAQRQKDFEHAMTQIETLLAANGFRYLHTKTWRPQQPK